MPAENNRTDSAKGRKQQYVVHVQVMGDTHARWNGDPDRIRIPPRCGGSLSHWSRRQHGVLCTPSSDRFARVPRRMPQSAKLPFAVVLPIRVALEDGLPLIAADGDMVHGAFVFDPLRSGHARVLPPGQQTGNPAILYLEGWQRSENLDR